MVSFAALIDMIDLIKLIFTLVLIVLVTKVLADIFGLKINLFAVLIILAFSFLVLLPSNNVYADLLIDTDNQVLTSEVRENQTIFYENDDIDYWFNDCLFVNVSFVNNHSFILNGPYLNNTSFYDCSFYANSSVRLMSIFYVNSGKIGVYNSSFYDFCEHLLVQTNQKLDFFNNSAIGFNYAFLNTFQNGIIYYNYMLTLNSPKPYSTTTYYFQYTTITIDESFDVITLNSLIFQKSDFFIPHVYFHWVDVYGDWKFQPINYSITIERTNFFNFYENRSFSLNEIYYLNMTSSPTTITLTVNVFDSLGNPLNNVTVSLSDQNNSFGYYANFNQTNIFTIQSGTYYLHSSKYLFETQTYLLIFSSNTIVNIYLDFNDTLDYDKELIEYEIELWKAANKDNNSYFSRNIFYVGVFLIIFGIFCIVLLKWK